MFRSVRRDLVFPQAEHARLAAAIAAAWNDDVAPIRLPRESFVLGVARHDKGYGEQDADEIGAVPADRWLAIQELSFAPLGEDAVVDVVVGLHVRRLVSHHTDDACLRALRAMDDALPELLQTADVTPADALAADRITDLCDRISFDFCLEEPGSGTVEVLAVDRGPVSVTYTVDGRGGITLAPWPLRQPSLSGTVVAYRAAGYPETLVPVTTPYEIVAA